MATKKRVTRRPRTPHAASGNIGEIRPENLMVFGTREMGLYAEEVNLARAVPDLVDGLKPVQRRIMWASSLLGKDFVKTARTVGECFSPDTLVRLEGGAQIPMEDLRIGDMVCTDVGPRPITELYELHDKDLYEVTTDHGVVRATPDQVFYCIDARGLEVERTPLTLAPGDKIITYKRG